MVLATDASLRIGDAPTLLREWRTRRTPSLLLVTELPPDLGLLLAPFQPLGEVRQLVCPLDAACDAAEVADVLRELRPARVLLPGGDGQQSAQTTSQPVTSIFLPEDTEELRLDVVRAISVTNMFTRLLVDVLTVVPVEVPCALCAKEKGHRPMGIRRRAQATWAAEDRSRRL